MSFPFKAGFGNLAKPDFTYLHSGNSAEKFPPAGGMGDWGLPQQARLSYKRYACVNAATGGVGISKVPIILLMRKSAMKCGRWRMRYRLTSPIRGSGCDSLMSASTSSVESHRSILQSKSTLLSPRSAINGVVFRLKRHSLLSQILCPPMVQSVSCRIMT